MNLSICHPTGTTVFFLQIVHAPDVVFILEMFSAGQTKIASPFTVQPKFPVLLCKWRTLTFSSNCSSHHCWKRKWGIISDNFDTHCLTLSPVDKWDNMHYLDVRKTFSNRLWFHTAAGDSDLIIAQKFFPDIFNSEFAKIGSYHEYFFQTILTCLSEMIMLGIAQEKFYNHTAVFTTSLAKLGELLFYTIIFFSESSLFISLNFRFS